jgi:hypothetical protein
MPKLLRLEVFSQSTRFYELIFAYCFYAGASAGMVSGGMSGEQAFFFFFLLFPAHLVSPCCYANAAHSQHGMFKDLPSFVTICTPQCLVVKVTCMQDVWIIAEGFPERAWVFLLSTVFAHHLAQPENLGIIAWLLHCSSLAVCAQGMAAARPRLVVALNIQTLCQTSDLSASSTCLHTCMLTQCQAFQVEHIWSCLVLLIFSSPQASVLNVRNHACMNMHT